MRKLKDNIKNIEDMRLLEMVEENGWEILNENMEGDEEGEHTFIWGQGISVIDYVLIKTKIKKEIRIEEGESNHLPMVVEIYGDYTREKQVEEQLKEKRIWTEEGKRFYQEEVNRIIFEKEETNETMEEIKQKINGT